MKSDGTVFHAVPVSMLGLGELSACKGALDDDFRIRVQVLHPVVA